MTTVTTPQLSAALDYAWRGWRVVPITPGTKYPPMDEWTVQATTDPPLLRHWWNTAYPGYGVGIRTGLVEDGRCLFVIDVDTSEHKTGDESLADLEATYQPLPDTYEVITGSGGRHLYYYAPKGVTITNASAPMGAFVDIRGEGGQVLAPPTVHPETGNAYQLEASSTTEPVMAPEWLIELLTTAATDSAARRETVPYEGPPRPGDIFAANVSWPELLEADGALYIGTRRAHRIEGAPEYELWSRPGLPDTDRHTSATLYFGGSDVLKVHTSNWTVTDRETGELVTLEQEQTYTRFGYYVATRYSGDFEAATADIAREYGIPHPDSQMVDAINAPEPNTPERDKDSGSDSGWQEVDLAPFMEAGWEPPRPEILHRHDGVALLYRGRINAIQGESGHGKSWIAMAACAEVIQAGGHVAYIDWEDHPASVMVRMRLLGCADQQILEQFHYIQPDGPVTRATQAFLLDLVAEHAVELVVIDSLGESIASEGLNPDKDPEVARWFNLIARPLAAAGPAVAALDHVVKDTEKRGLWASGSHRKRAAIDGVAYMVEPEQIPSRDTIGLIRLRCAKDRNGAFAGGETVARVTIDATDGNQVVIEIDPGKDRSYEPTRMMHQIADALVAGPLNTSALGKAIGVKRGRKSGDVGRAIDLLEEQGYIEVTDGERNSKVHMLLREYNPDGEMIRAIQPVDNRVVPVVPSGSGNTEQVDSQSPTSGSAGRSRAVGASLLEPLSSAQPEQLKNPSSGSAPTDDPDPEF